MKKTYRLTYESVDILRAVFDRSTAKSRWAVGAPLLKVFSEYFGSRTEHLDAYYDGQKMIFTSYTEKVMKGKGLFPICSFGTNTILGIGI